MYCITYQLKFVNFISQNLCFDQMLYSMVRLRKILSCERISEYTSYITTNSKRKGTLSNYEPPWKKMRQVPVEGIIEYLAFLFNFVTNIEQ